MSRNILLLSLPFALLLLFSCGKHKKPTSENSSEVIVPDTLKAATLYGPTSYFTYRGQEMGFEYENLRQFAQDKGYVLNLKVAPSLQSLLKMVSSGEVQLAAYPIPIIDEYISQIKHCGPREITWQVLVQPAGKDHITDVTELIGKTIFVEEDSKYHFRLKNLNNELGGGIDIIPISKDTLIAEDMIEMVDQGKIPLTVVDSDIAELNKSYFPRLDISMKVSLDQYSSWAVNNQCDSLAIELDTWNKETRSSEMIRSIYRKYFEESKKTDDSDVIAEVLSEKFKKGESISRYDNIFKKHAAIPGYDWELLAAIGYNESRFNNDIVSWAGAKGVMQLMPVTAQAMGIKWENAGNPDYNILGAARLLKYLDDALSDKVKDPKERILFVLAAYNSGLGHIYDAIALADKYGLDSQIWFGNASEAALMKSRPQYYNDPVVKNGYFRGRETVDFVERVMTTYSFFKNLNHR